MARKYRYSKRRIGIMLLILFLLLGGIGWGIAFLFQKIDEQDKTMVLTFGELDLSGEHPAVVIRNEMIIQTNANGSLAYFVESGELVERNDPIMEIFNDSTAQEQEATIIPEQGQLSGETAKVALDYERNEYELQQKRDRILALIRKGDYYGASVEKEEFHLLMDAHEKMRSDHQFLARNQISFREKTIGERLLPNQRLTVFAPVSGLLSFAIDGLEDTVKPNLAMTL
ncbi:MAG: HlyD family efflux transporter periplasmic adaptor subunit, partial [Bacillota bacterium]|nr:HlyD family efflux transporter periplasmic adaptor subunit [Bacillota bacterium]